MFVYVLLLRQLDSLKEILNRLDELFVEVLKCCITKSPPDCYQHERRVHDNAPLTTELLLYLEVDNLVKTRLF